MENRNSYRNNFLYSASLFLITLIPFILIFLLPHHRIVKIISAIIRYNNPITVLAVSLLLLAGFLIKDHRISNLFIAFIISFFFAFALNGLWETMHTEKNVIAGILPRRDALSYFGSAMSFLEKGVMLGYSAKRSLFSSFFASLLWIFDNHLTIVIAVIAYLSALAAFFSISEVSDLLDPISAVVFFIPQFLYYRMYIGNIMSETLAFILGILAFVFFLRYLREMGSNKQRIKNALIAVFCFTLSQLTRPGAIVTLPLLALFFGRKESEKRKKYISFFLVLLVMLSAFLIDKAFFSIFAASETTHNSNAFNGLYGVVSGGNFWWQLDKDFPQIQSLESGIRELKIMEIIFTEFFTNPLNFIKGMRHQFSVIFSLNPINQYNIYSYMLSNDEMKDAIMIIMYYLLSLIGLFSICRHFSRPVNKLASVLLVGFLFSLPFAPAYHEQFMRFYPATIPFLGLLPALGSSMIYDHVIGKIKSWKKIFPRKEMSFVSRSQSVFTVPLLAFILIMPLFVLLFSQKKPFEQLLCPQELDQVMVFYYPTTEININKFDRTGLPYISDSKFKIGIHNIPNQSDMQAFDAIPIPSIVYPSFDLISDQPIYVVLPAGNIPSQKTIFNYCGKRDDWPGLSLFYPELTLHESDILIP